MPEALIFGKIYNYNTLLTGIAVPIIIDSGAEMVEINAKIDTGATHCIFERKYGDFLRLDVEKGTKIEVGTARGSFPAYGHEVTIGMFGWQWDTTVYFIEEEGIKRNVLGRQGWLDHINLGLVDYEGKLLLSVYGKDLS